jgi:hypothetical protein
MDAVKAIAKATGNDPQTIRLKMQEKDCVFGTAVEKNGRYTYIPYVAKVRELFGVNLNEDEETDSKCATCRCYYEYGERTDCDNKPLLP